MGTLPLAICSCWAAFRLLLYALSLLVPAPSNRLWLSRRYKFDVIIALALPLRVEGTDCWILRVSLPFPVRRRRQQTNEDHALAPRLEGRSDSSSLRVLGTCVFLILSLGTAQSVTYLNTILDSSAGASNTADFMYISAGFGLALLVAAWLFFRVSGALFNPNISTSLLLIGVITPFRYILYVTAQLIGSICAAAVVQALMPGPLSVNTVPNPLVNRARVSEAPRVSASQTVDALGIGICNDVAGEAVATCTQLPRAYKFRGTCATSCVPGGFVIPTLWKRYRTLTTALEHRRQESSS